MRDYVELGPSPADEPCAQLGSDDYYEKSTEECNRYRDLLIAKFGHPERFAVKTFQHDFGAYREVVVFFDDDDEAQVHFAFNVVEHNLPEKWED